MRQSSILLSLQPRTPSRLETEEQYSYEHGQHTSKEASKQARDYSSVRLGSIRWPSISAEHEKGMKAKQEGAEATFRDGRAR